MSFLTESLEMGLETIDHGLYEYRDRYSSVWYEILRGVTRELELPSLAIFTGGPDTPIEDRQYVGAVSTEYKFFGNAMAVDAVHESISNLSSGSNNIFPKNYCSLDLIFFCKNN